MSVNRFLACWLCVFAFTATAASADEDVSGDWRIQSLIGVAGAHWRAVPDCPDGIVVTATPLSGVVMEAREPGCNVWIAQAFWDENPPPWRLCTFFVHEYGHLLGHTHQDPDPVMQEQEPPECTAMFRAAFPPPFRWHRRWRWR